MYFLFDSYPQITYTRVINEQQRFDIFNIHLYFLIKLLN